MKTTTSQLLATFKALRHYPKGAPARLRLAEWLRHLLATKPRETIYGYLFGVRND